MEDKPRKKTRLFDDSMTAAQVEKNMLKAGFISISVPLEYRKHPLVHEKLFYTLPEDLLEEIRKYVGNDILNPDLLKMEFALSKIMGNHQNRVGFWAGAPISYNWLDQGSSTISEAARKMCDPKGKTNDSQWGGKEECQQKNDNRLFSFMMGYNGWLLTNPEFLRDHDELFSRHMEMVYKYGTALMFVWNSRPGERIKHPQLLAAKDGSPEKMYVQALENFFAKWMISGLPGPYLPVPIGPQVPAIYPFSSLGFLPAAGNTMYLPKTFPTPPADDLKHMAEELRASDIPLHIKEWSDIASGKDITGQGEKITADRFGRIFRLQHYLSAFYCRHANCLGRAMGKLQEAFANYFGMDPRMIRDDMTRIAGRIGEDWYKRRYGPR